MNGQPDNNGANERENISAERVQKLLNNAAYHGNIEALKQAIAAGANVNAIIAGPGASPLHWAATNGLTNICKLLPEHGADVNAAAEHGNTPLHWTATNGHTNICKLLPEHGADVHTEDERGNTPLRLSHTFIPRVFRDFENDEGDDTPLQRKYAEVCKLLRQYAVCTPVAGERVPCGMP